MVLLLLEVLSWEKGGGDEAGGAVGWFGKGRGVV